MKQTAKTIPAFTARRQFGQILHTVEVDGQPIVVERHGEAVAAVVPMQVYQQWKKGREAFFARLKAIAQQSDVFSEEEAVSLAAEAVTQVRRHS